MKASIINLALLAASTSAWSIVYHSDSDCRGDIVAHSNLPDAAQSESECEAPGATPGSDPSVRVRSARISGLDEALDENRWSASTRTTVRFYSNNDCLNNCTHRYVLDQSDWDDCISFYGSSRTSKGLKTDSPSIALKDISFNVVKLGRVGSLSNYNSGEYSAALSDGFCLLSHGDKVVVHGREYRMQQVAASWFHDIPVEDWNDAIHTKSTENRFAQHGDVDVTGEKKMWQQTADYSHGIPLEQWNDSIHVKAEASEEANDDLMYAIDRYCRIVALDDTVIVQDMSSKVPSLNVAKVCEEVKKKMKEIEQEELAMMAEELGGALVEQT